MSLAAKIKAGTKSLDSMEDLLIEELQDLYDVENRIIDSLPDMADAAESPKLKSAFSDHLNQSKRQRERLEECFRELDEEPERGNCEGIKGILEEGEIMMKASGPAKVKDAALVASAQRVEHYEMAGYGAARTFASHLGKARVAELLQQTLDEEGNTDHKLTAIAEGQVNPPKV